jgi:hypothetical protein
MIKSLCNSFPFGMSMIECKHEIFLSIVLCKERETKSFDCASLTLDDAMIKSLCDSFPVGMGMIECKS